MLVVALIVSAIIDEDGARRQALPLCHDVLSERLCAIAHRDFETVAPGLLNGIIQLSARVGVSPFCLARTPFEGRERRRQCRPPSSP